MAEGRLMRADVFMIIAIIVVMVGGFWMMGKAQEEKTEALRAKLGAVELSAQQAVDKLTDVQKQLGEIKKTLGAPAPAAAPAKAAAPAPAAAPAKAAAPAPAAAPKASPPTMAPAPAKTPTPAKAPAAPRKTT